MLKLLKYLKPFTAFVVASMVMIFLQTMTDLYLPTLMSDIVDNGMLKGDTGYILKVGGYMLIIAAGNVIFSVLGGLFSAIAGVGFGRDLRNVLFTRAASFSLHEFDKIGTASLITRTTNDITQVQMVLIMIMRMMISAPMMCIGGLVLAISKDRKLTLVLAVAIPCLALLVAIFSRIAIPLFRSLQKKLDKLNLVSRENLTGVRVIRAFNRIGSEKERFREANSDLTNTAIKVNKIMSAMMPLTHIIMNLTSIAIIWFGSLRINAGHIEPGDMMAFLQYAMQILFSLLMVNMLFIAVPRAQASAARINEVLDMKPEINNPEVPKVPDQLKGHVEFRDVTFTYPGASQPVLSNISFTANPGEVTAIIGSTGSGKSTLVNLILRFYDADSGSVLVDGVDVREMDQQHLRSKIGYVPQRAVLFSGSVADNINYGKEDATDDEIRHAAEVAQALDFISEMKDGFGSIISQGGTNISGGQKQRLSIARALVRRPEIYIFDDSFSALDFKTDAKLRRALREETRESTVLIVAQRVSTIMDADKIIVLDNGKIVGMGKHKELVKSCDVYREIVASQLSEEELA